MKKICNALIIAACIALFAAMHGVAQEPAFNVHALTSAQPLPHTLMYKGKNAYPTPLVQELGAISIVNIWATWCTPCLKEMPTLDALQRRYAAAGLKVIPLAMDEDPTPISRFYTQANLHNLPIYFDPLKSAATIWDVKTYPTTYILKGDEVIAYLAGADDWYRPAARAYIEALLRDVAPNSTDKPTALHPHRPIYDVNTGF